MINLIYYNALWQRGGMVTQRIANPSIPVRFWAWPPKFYVVLISKKSILILYYSSVAQLVEQLTVNQLVAGSSPARGAKKTYADFSVTFVIFNTCINFSFF